MAVGLSEARPNVAGARIANRWRRDRTFFTGMAVAAAATVFVGFAPTYYLKGIYGTPALRPILHVHGALFTSWIVLLVAQTSLVAANRTDLHRRLGVAGGVLAALMTAVALATAVSAARVGSMDAAFLVIPFGTVIVFPALVGAALLLRRHTDAHKRLIVIATTELLSAGVGRLPGLSTSPPLVFFALTDLFVLALLVYDMVTRGRVHPATFWGGLFLIASQPLRMAVAGTNTWLAFAGWLTS